MNGKPAFFDRIRQHASDLWDKLERDPELAGPWHQLFNQVQSPRHVLSELLQNADDVGATEASVSIEEGALIFTHNGEDFTEEHFASLCRFAYSNKRDLHTIGFRGIGFKSTFSLGDNVELYTPSLSVVFNRKRFTEPIWVNKKNIVEAGTQVRVIIRDQHRQQEIEKNLQEWLKSPISLLFFRHIRHLQIGEHDLFWQSCGLGPVEGTEMMALQEDPEHLFLVARSDNELFPEECLTEIMQERLLSTEQDMEFPPCKVEIVLGAKGRLYVVLPTGVETALPFACNAPFIQDPARLKIKDPEISPTNRWLLERIGSLSASVMLQWLAHGNESVSKKSHAYDLLPDVDRNNIITMEGMCAVIVEMSFEAEIEGKAFLLTEAGTLKESGQSIVIPETLIDIWPAEQASVLFDEACRPALSRYVLENNTKKLINWGVVEKITKDKIVNILKSKHLPRPKNWRNLLKLWSYVAPEVVNYRARQDSGSYCIIPVQGKDMLYAASEVVRVGEKKLLQSDTDWDFLATHLLVLNQNWPRFLAEQRRQAGDENDKNEQSDVDAAYAVLKAIGLEETSNINIMIERVASKFFTKESVSLSGCIQIAQIASKLGATIGESFRFATQDLRLRGVKHVVLYDVDGTLEELFPDSWCSEHFLHPDYTKSFYSCTSDEWSRWISSGHAGIHTFAPLVEKSSIVWGRQKIETHLRERGFTGRPFYPYVTSRFEVDDWDFDKSHWIYWNTLIEDDDNFWGHLVGRIINQTEIYWSKAKSMQVFQCATTGSTRVITHDPLLPTWVIKLRDLPCLPDTRGFYHRPADLLRRTLETESLIDIEPFIHGRLDTESTRPLLKLLGVRDKPTGPERLLDCLRALAKSNDPPVHEVEKWYRRLDLMTDTCSTDEFSIIKKTLFEENVILLESLGWAKASDVFISSNEEDVPGAAVIRISVSNLSLWRKIGIAERPNTDLAIQWLKLLPSGKILPQEEVRRVRALLPRHAPRIWNECGHWLNLVGEWALTSTLSFSLTMQTLIPWGHLHEWVKQKTADFQRLPIELIESYPFCDLPALASHIEERLCRSAQRQNNPEHKIWLNQLGIELCQIELDDVLETERVRVLAAELADTGWQVTQDLEIVPYINGTPAGTTRSVEVVWLNKILYVGQLPQAKLARLVPDKLGKIFNRPEIIAALNYCYERTPEQIIEYIEGNFKLAPRTIAVTSVDEAEQIVGEHNNINILKPSNNNNLEDQTTAALTNQVDVALAEQSESKDEPTKVNEETVELDGIDFRPDWVQPHPKATKSRIIERFAQSIGFQKDGDDRFFCADGRWIGKTIGDCFPWEMRTTTGEIVRYYWPKEHCLERETLQIEADVWSMMMNSPSLYAFILLNQEGNPIEVQGENVRTMLDEGKIKLYPATYRLVYNQDKY